MKTVGQSWDALPYPKPAPTYEEWVDMWETKVVETLAAHDQLKAHERETFKAFLAGVIAEASLGATCCRIIVNLGERIAKLEKLVAEQQKLLAERK